MDTPRENGTEQPYSDPHSPCSNQQLVLISVPTAPTNTHRLPCSVQPGLTGFTPATSPCSPGHSRHVRAQAVVSPASLSIVQGNAGENLNTDTQLRVEKFFEVEMSVRDCELDQYGVVNHTIYAVYIDKAREELAASLCINMGSIARTGHAMALSELNLKYTTPLRRGDRFVVKVRPAKIKGARIYMKHLIETLPDRKTVLEATATVVCLDEDYRPTRVFPEMLSKLQQRFFYSAS